MDKVSVVKNALLMDDEKNKPANAITNDFQQMCSNTRLKWTEVAVKLCACVFFVGLALDDFPISVDG